MFIQPDILYLSSQIRQLESFLVEEGLVTEKDLMQKAGEAILSTVLESWPKTQSVLVFCGLGNNAGDALVFAKQALAHGMNVQVVHIGHPDEFRPLAAEFLADFLGAGGRCVALSEVVTTLDSLLEAADILIDALLGIGLARDIEGDMALLVNLMNQSTLPVLAVDIPTGLDADNGRIHACAVRADVTVTFIGLKQGMFTHRASHYCGKIICSDLDIATENYRQLSPSAMLLTWKKIRANLPRRVRDANKGRYGHALVIGGDYGMGGAIRMAAEAAMRVGAGLVTVATRPEHVAIVNCSRPEIMCHQVTNAKDLDRLIAAANVIILGPGLGQGEWSQALYARVMESQKVKVLDADALTLLSAAPVRSENWVLTPHPGEAARLLGAAVEELQDDRFAAATELQQCYGGVSVLKGAGTIIKSDDPVPAVCRAGNPGMATGGMGDVLTGIIGGLIAQGLDIFDAAEVGVFVHAVAADRAASQEGERGLLASDVLAQLRSVVNPRD